MADNIYRIGSNLYRVYGDIKGPSYTFTYGQQPDGTVDNDPANWTSNTLVAAIDDNKLVICVGYPIGFMVTPLSTKASFINFLVDTWGLLGVDVGFYTFT